MWKVDPPPKQMSQVDLNLVSNDLIRKSPIYSKCDVYFDQLLGTVCTRKLVKPIFWDVFNLFCSFQTVFSDFSAEIKKDMYFCKKITQTLQFTFLHLFNSLFIC